MSLLFETAYRVKYDYYERVFDTVEGKSKSRKITLPSEWYEEDSRGQYRSVLDDSIKLKKFQGSSKTARDQWGFIDPVYRNIRDCYWTETPEQLKYNSSPRIMSIDIETRVSRSYKHLFGDTKIKIRNEIKEETHISVTELQSKLYNGGEEAFEYYDDKSNTWEDLENSKYFERNTGFPQPSKALEEISLIQLFDNKTETMFVIGIRDWKHQSNYNYDFEVKYIKTDNEVQLIQTFLKIFQKINPLIIYAWNGVGFDYPYLYNRISKLGLDTNDLSVYGNASLKEKQYGHVTIYNLNSDGHHFLDSLEVYKNFTFGEQSSYSLDFTAELILGKKKVDHSEYEAFDDFYTGNYKIPQDPTDEQKNSEIYKQAVSGNWDEVRELAHSDFVHYGIIDTHLIVEIDKAKNFTAIMFNIAEKMGVLVSDSMGTVKPWSQYIANKSHLKKQVIAKLHVDEENSSIKGGYVADPVQGKHNWVLSADVNSMYPLLGMVGFNMSPESFVPKHKLPNELREIVLRYFNDEDEEARFDIPEEIWARTESLLKEHNFSLGINGAVFRRDEVAMVPQMVQEIYNTRKADKKTMFKYSKKVILIKSILKERLETL